MEWVVTGYAALGAVLMATAAGVSLFVADKGRRDMAYKVLKLVLGAASGTSGMMIAL